MKERKSMTSKIKGRFTYIIYHNQENGYLVASFKAEKPYGNITVTGTLFEVDMHIEYELEGEFKLHIKYGEQFNFNYYHKIYATEEDGIVSFLSSSSFKGIGRKTAEKIVELLGNNTLMLLKENSNILLEYGFKKKYIESIIQGLNENQDIGSDLIQLREFGITTQILNLAKSKFKEDYINILKTRPYYASRHIRGYSVKLADYYCSNSKTEIDEECRDTAVFYEFLRKESLNSGSTYVELSNLEISESILNGLINEKLVIVENGKIYLKPLFESENYIAQYLNYFINEEKIDFSIENLIKIQERDFNIKYDSSQVDAIKSFFSNNFLILSGGPGTGKTTVTRAMVDIYKKQYPRKKIAICAPTGRAAKRISEVCDTEATTIHRLLKWDLENEEFNVNQNNPLDISLLVVDEFSMVDVFLFASLLKGAVNVEKILLIGDKDQLPSIAPGEVLKDLLSIEHISSIELNTNHRQKKISGIVELARNINQLEKLVDYPNVVFYEDIPFENYFVADLLKKLESGINDFQVLSSMYRGQYGIDNLNYFLQNLLNPSNENKKEIKVGNKIYRMYDKVLQLKNQVEENVYNGDIGIICDIDLVQKEIAVDYDSNIVIYDSSQFENITHGYCVSVHKAQGSEYSLLYLFLPDEHHYMFEKKLIYTGITRAKQELVIFGNKNIIESCVQRVPRINRKSTLIERINELFSYGV